MWVGFKPSQNPGWDLNPRGWATNPAKPHGTWFKDLMKAQLLDASSCKEFSERKSDRWEEDLFRLREQHTAQSVGRLKGECALSEVT